MEYKISIIVPVFNVEDYIKESLESIIFQTIGFENLEVIMVNDCSTDSSGKIIDEYSKKYENFISVHLEENSGAAGKPRNVGISLAKGKYLMFLDPDDYFKPEACEVLYNKIEKDDLDVVSGKYDIILDNNAKMNVNYQLYSLGDELTYLNNVELFFGSVPSIWTKIFRKNFILEKDITFPEGIPAQDLVFYIHSLLKTNKITYINKKIVTYRKRENENKSISFNISEQYMIGLTNAYKKVYELCNDEDKEEYFAYVIKGHIIFWCRQLILSDLRDVEKIKIMKNASSLFKIYKKFNLKPPQYLSKFFSEIRNENYDVAVLLTKELKDYIEKDINENKEEMMKRFKNSTKKKNIFFICDKIPAELGGLARIVLQKSEFFSKKGHKVKILTIDDDADYEDIQSKLIERNQLHPDIELINIYNYYGKINTKEQKLSYKFSNKQSTEKDEEIYTLVEDSENEETIKYFHNGCLFKTKTLLDNELSSISYFDENSIKIKEKTFINGRLCIVISYHNNNVRTRRYFTNDGFCFLTKSFNYKGKLNELFLFNRDDNKVLSFSDEEDFFKHFFIDISNSVEDKPYLICEGSGPSPKISNIDSKIAYKVSSLHSNPYLGNYCYGSPMRSIGILEDIGNVDSFVTLTERQRLDLLKEFGDYNNSFQIPNFVPYVEKGNVKKKLNTITIFSRIAPEKRLDHAIKSFKLVVDEKPDAILEIYGRATLHREKEELKKINYLIENLNLENNVFFKGYILDVYDVMAESLATLLTSNFEGFPMALLESMVNSTPVISYDLNYGPSDVIEHGVNGFLAEYSDFEDLAKYMIELLDNPDKAIKMGENARKTVIEKFSTEVVMKQWEELLDNVPFIEKRENPIILVKNKDKEQNLSNNTNLDQIHEELSDKDKIIKKLENELSNKNTHLDQIHEELSDKDKIIKKLENELSNKNTHLDQIHEELLIISNLKSYRIAYFLHRTFNSFIKGNISDKNIYLKWLFFKTFRKKNKYTKLHNPILKLVDKIKNF